MPEADAGNAQDAAQVLRVHDVSKRFGAVLANDRISLTLRRGEVLALLGENGAGKTTLMNVLFGHYVPDAGHIEAFGATLPPGSPSAALAAGIGMVHQHFTLAANLSVLDNVMLGTEPLWRLTQNRQGARAELARLSRDFGLSVNADAVVGALSIGEQQRVEILKALYRDVKILILDEPTAVLTPQEADKLFDTLRQMIGKGLSVIFISHKLNEVLAVAHRIAVLRQGRLVGEYPAARADRPSLAAAMVGHDIPQPKRRALAPGKAALELRDVSATPSRGAAISNVRLTVRAHQIVGIAGVSGNGQRTLADMLAGLLTPRHGDVLLFGERVARFEPARMTALGVGRIPEDRHGVGIIGDMGLSENLILETYRDTRFQRLGWFRRRAVARYVAELVARFDIRGAEDLAVRSLSGGNIQKLILARVLSRRPQVIVASQPTRGLDVGAAAYVHEQLFEARERGAAILLISEDLEELLSVADAVAVMYHGRLSPCRPVESLALTELGLLMSGHGATAPEHDRAH